MANVLKTLHNIVDTLFIGLIPDQTIATQMQAAIGLTWPIFFIFLSFGMGLSVASNGLIGQFVGKRIMKTRLNMRLILFIYLLY